MLDGLSNQIRILLESHGVDPVYFATIVLLVLLAIDYKDILRWEDLSSLRQRSIVAIGVVAILFSTISLLRLFGVVTAF